MPDLGTRTYQSRRIRERHWRNAGLTQKILEMTTHMTERVADRSDEAQAGQILIMQPRPKLFPACEQRDGWKRRLQARRVVDQRRKFATHSLQDGAIDAP